MTPEADADRTFVGRVETVETLRRQLEDLRAGLGGTTLLVGDTGVGKSLLVDELVGDARARGIPVLVGRAPPLDDPPPFALIRSAIESARSDPTLRGSDLVRGDRESVLIGFAPSMGAETLPTAASVEEQLLGVLADRPEAAHDRVLPALAEQFRELAQRSPIVLVFDDLHRADESSLAAIQYLATELRGDRLWVLATVRPHGSLSESGRARLEAFEGATRARSVPLHPLTTNEVAEYLRRTEPARSFSTDEVLRRFGETGGNPLLLEQLGHRLASGVPARAVSAAPVESLDPDEQRTIDVAAVLGPEFGFELLMRASGEQDEERFAEVVDHLVALGLLYERPGELLAFPDDRLREEAYDRLPERRRSNLHWTAGETLEAMGSSGIGSVYSLARHFYLGKLASKSVKYNRQAAEIADRALAPEVARDHLARALESLRSLEPHNRLLESEIILELAQLREGLGELSGAERLLREFLQGATGDLRLPASSRASLQILLARVLTDQGALAEAAEIARSVLSTPGMDRHLPVLVGGHHQLGQALYYEGKYAESLAEHTEELRLAREVGNDLVTLRAEVWRTAALAMIGPTDEAVAEARRVTVRRDRLGSTRESAQAHLFFGDLLADARCTPEQRKEALAEYAEAIRFAERAQDPRRIGWAKYKTGELLNEFGRFTEATDAAEESCEVFRRIGDRVGLSMATKVKGQIAMDQRAYEVAERELLEARRLLAGLQHQLEEIDVELRLAQLAFARGDRASAQKGVEELERRGLRSARPDLIVEFERLRKGVRSNDGDTEAS